MLVRSLVGFGAGLCVLIGASLAHAQCTKDTDCKGERVCDGGTCVTPPAPAVPAGAAVPATSAAPGTPAPAAAEAPPPPAPSAAAPPPLPQEPAPRRRHSTGMMAGGIVMVSFVPVALIVSLVANGKQTACESGGIYISGSGIETFDGKDCSDYDPAIYGGLIAAAALAGVGIPLIVIGGKREPAATAAISPWATPHSAGIGLRLEM